MSLLSFVIGVALLLHSIRNVLLAGRRLTEVAETKSITQRPAWQALAAHHQKIKDVTLKSLFARDATRGERLTLEDVGLYFDYSKHRITDETLKLLLELANERGLAERLDAMFRGDKINVTENRAVAACCLARAAWTLESLWMA